MASFITQRAKSNQKQIKQNAEENKKLVAKQKNILKQEKPKETQPQNIEIVKEPQTIMLDIN